MEKSNSIHKTFKSFLLSRKLWATLLSLVLLWLMYWKQIDYLFAFALYETDKASVLIPAFTGLTRDVMVCFTAIIGAYLGIQGLVQWKHGTESVINQISENINKTETISIKEEKYIFYNSKEEDYHIGEPLIDEDDKGGKYEY